MLKAAGAGVEDSGTGQGGGRDTTMNGVSQTTELGERQEVRKDRTFVTGRKKDAARLTVQAPGRVSATGWGRGGVAS